VVTFVPFVMKIICVNLRNLWFPFCLSVFVSWWLCDDESIMQNKPNLLNTQMSVSSVKTKHYENKRLCRCDEKQTQTKPISNVTFQNGASREFGMGIGMGRFVE
jgi:hypothetical protein